MLWMAESWSENEVELIVADYLDMLAAEMTGRPYSKTEHRRRLIGRLRDRSEGSIERKHQNISAVLLDMGVPYIDGYKPLRNYQRQLLPDKVLELLVSDESLLDTLERNALAEPQVPSVRDILAIMERPPEQPGRPAHDHIYERPEARPRAAFDYLRQEAANARLGLAGELLVINFEKARLIHAGRENLAEKIEHIAQTEGAVAGYDVRSYETTGHDRFIEAKTTRHGRETPFYVTRNELAVSRENHERYWLYRVYRYGHSPRLYSLSGALDRTFILRPHDYVATGVAS